jgi:hypothetical protein
MPVHPAPETVSPSLTVQAIIPSPFDKNRVSILGVAVRFLSVGVGVHPEGFLSTSIGAMFCGKMAYNTPI